MFEKAETAFSVYENKFKEEDFELFVTNCEIRKKLGQLNWLLVRCQQLTQAIESSADTDPDFDSLYELEIHAESFYHFAFRMREVLQNLHPRFKKFESVGIRDVRNHLINHPERQGSKAKMYPSMSLSCETGQGPRIKGYIGPDYSIEDRGLFVNAEEMAQALESIFSKSAF